MRVLVLILALVSPLAWSYDDCLVILCLSGNKGEWRTINECKNDVEEWLRDRPPHNLSCDNQDRLYSLDGYYDACPAGTKALERGHQVWTRKEIITGIGDAGDGLVYGGEHAYAGRQFSDPLAKTCVSGKKHEVIVFDYITYGYKTYDTYDAVSTAEMHVGPFQVITDDRTYKDYRRP